MGVLSDRRQYVATRGSAALVLGYGVLEWYTRGMQVAPLQMIASAVCFLGLFVLLVGVDATLTNTAETVVVGFLLFVVVDRLTELVFSAFGPGTYAGLALAAAVVALVLLTNWDATHTTGT
ncbi:MAG: hypothetical protein ABEI77_05570 [Halorientalis sp.]